MLEERVGVVRTLSPRMRIDSRGAGLTELTGLSGSSMAGWWKTPPRMDRYR